MGCQIKPRSGRNLTQAVALRPDHLSLYALTLEHGTPMEKWVRRGLLSEPDQDSAAEMYEFSMDYLGRRDISNMRYPTGQEGDQGICEALPPQPAILAEPAVSGSRSRSAWVCQWSARSQRACAGQIYSPLQEGMGELRISKNTFYCQPRIDEKGMKWLKQ